MNTFNKVPYVGRLRTCLELARSQNIKGKVVIDVGCSDGLVAHHLIPVQPKKFIGIDPNPKAIEKAKKIIKKANFFVSTADKVPMNDKSADIVLMFDVIEHVPVGSEQIALKEAFRVLKKDGILLLSTPNSHPLTNLLDVAWYFGHRHYNPQQIKKLLHLSGFEVIHLNVKGGLWFSIYLLWLYVMKWIFKTPHPRNKFLESMDDNQFSKEGIHTIFAVAKRK